MSYLCPQNCPREQEATTQGRSSVSSLTHDHSVLGPSPTVNFLALAHKSPLFTDCIFVLPAWLYPLYIHRYCHLLVTILIQSSCVWPYPRFHLFVTEWHPQGSHYQSSNNDTHPTHIVIAFLAVYLRCYRLSFAPNYPLFSSDVSQATVSLSQQTHLQPRSSFG
jgi:hypothetical protein